MDLGLSTLTDDQLVELLGEVCAEAANRDPIVRQATQVAIDQEAARLKIKRQESQRLIFNEEQKTKQLEVCYGVAVTKTMEEYTAQLHREVSEMVRQDIEAGTLVLFTPEQEAELIVQAEKRAEESARESVRARTQNYQNPTYEWRRPPAGTPPSPVIDQKSDRQSGSDVHARGDDRFFKPNF